MVNSRLRISISRLDSKENWCLFKGQCVILTPLFHFLKISADKDLNSYCETHLGGRVGGTKWLQKDRWRQLGDESRCWISKKKCFCFLLYRTCYSKIIISIFLFEQKSIWNIMDSEGSQIYVKVFKESLKVVRVK